MPTKPSKAPGLLAIIAGGSGAKSPKTDNASEPGDLEVSAEELMASIKSGDAAAVADAFEAMVSLCGGYKNEE